MERKVQKKKKGGEKEKYRFPVTVKKGSRYDREAVACPGTKVIVSEPQRPHLTFLVMRKDEVVQKMYSG